VQERASMMAVGVACLVCSGVYSAFRPAAFVLAQQENPLEEQAKKLLGRVVEVCGIATYPCTTGQQTTLTIHEPYPRSRIDVFIAKEDRDRFDDLFPPGSVFPMLCATGTVNQRGNRYLITVTKPHELRGEPIVPVFTYSSDAMSGCDDRVDKPKLIREVKPSYTAEAMAAKIEGEVLLETVVLTNGRVGPVRILRSLGPRFRLDDEAVRALRGWRFSPGSFEGRAVPVVVTIAIAFKLRD
jgi:TonB family protein